MEQRIKWYYDNEKNFGEKAKQYISVLIKESSDEQFLQVARLKIKDPFVCLLLSILAGFIGSDRFYLGGKKNIIVGILKLFSLGGFFIMWIIDTVTAVKRTKMQNNKAVLDILNPQLSYEVFVNDTNAYVNSVNKTGNAVMKAADILNANNSRNQPPFR